MQVFLRQKKLDYEYQMRSTWLLGEVFQRYVSGFKKIRKTNYQMTIENWGGIEETWECEERNVT